MRSADSMKFATCAGRLTRKAMTADQLKAIQRATTSMRLAYQFGANSYTFAAMRDCALAEQAMRHPADWMAEFLAWGEA